MPSNVPSSDFFSRTPPHFVANHLLHNHFTLLSISTGLQYSPIRRPRLFEGLPLPSTTPCTSGASPSHAHLSYSVILTIIISRTSSSQLSFPPLLERTSQRALRHTISIVFLPSLAVPPLRSQTYWTSALLSCSWASLPRHELLSRFTSHTILTVCCDFASQLGSTTDPATQTVHLN